MCAPSAETPSVALTIAGVNVVYGMEVILWLSCLSFSVFPQLGVLPSLRKVGGGRRVSIGRFSMSTVTIIFVLATADMLLWLLPTLVSPVCIPSTTLPYPANDTVRVVRVILLIVLTVLTAFHISHRVYVVYAHDTPIARCVGPPAILIILAGACAFTLVVPTGRPGTPSGLWQLVFAVSSLALFAFHRIACALAIAWRLLRQHERLREALLARYNSMRRGMLSSATLAATPCVRHLPDPIRAEMEREYIFVARTFLVSAGLYSLFLTVLAILIAIRSHSELFFWSMLPQVTAMSTTLGLLQTAMSVVYNGMKAGDEQLMSHLVFARGRRPVHRRLSQESWGNLQGELELEGDGHCISDPPVHTLPPQPEAVNAPPVTTTPSGY
ncbi:hypothetical protein SISNIDRAFT_469457 [Sistotremastrum niveocremeum HHB9708]|uniref:Uncharacterized protein n=1 Tax=Sistotremastrum niveocremeum HHB9708 TaxID=1314777 RepID=A0A164PZ65_9AGAM|nr:hypothetical protein SISNIDRAFT_469457 [Sistotremastrum niveocremeum HHB9708]